MKSLWMLVVLLPHMITCDNSDVEKYQQQLPPSQSLYCNDLNPQSHLDFTMVKKAKVLITRRRDKALSDFP